MRLNQIGRYISQTLENELTHLFILLGDNQLPEEAHTPEHIYCIKHGIDASGLGRELFFDALKKGPLKNNVKNTTKKATTPHH